MNPNLYTWKQVATYLTTVEPGTILSLDKMRMEHPRDGGLTPSLGLPVGQRGDWRHAYPQCGGLHVRDLGDRYTAHLDRVNPNCDPLGHLIEDTPQIAGGAALGAVIGLLLGGSKEAMLAGAALGALIGVNAAASSETKGSSAT